MKIYEDSRSLEIEKMKQSIATFFNKAETGLQLPVVTRNEMPIIDTKLKKLPKSMNYKNMNKFIQ